MTSVVLPHPRDPTTKSTPSGLPESPRCFATDLLWSMTSVHTFFCPASNGVDGAREAEEEADLADGGLGTCDDDMVNDFFFET